MGIPDHGEGFRKTGLGEALFVALASIVLSSIAIGITIAVCYLTPYGTWPSFPFFAALAIGYSMTTAFNLSTAGPFFYRSFEDKVGRNMGIFDKLVFSTYFGGLYATVCVVVSLVLYYLTAHHLVPREIDGACCRGLLSGVAIMSFIWFTLVVLTHDNI
jgi:hypothetical protein